MAHSPGHKAQGKRRVLQTYLGFALDTFEAAQRRLVPLLLLLRRGFLLRRCLHCSMSFRGSRLLSGKGSGRYSSSGGRESSNSWDGGGGDMLVVVLVELQQKRRKRTRKRIRRRLLEKLRDDGGWRAEAARSLS